MDKCHWVMQADDETSQWETDCGECFEVTEGTPEENKFRYCCFCGKPIKEVIE